jgi:hypothetical protein
VPMCQSPKIANSLDQARTLAANDNNLLMEARTRSFQVSRPGGRSLGEPTTGAALATLSQQPLAKRAPSALQVGGRRGSIPINSSPRRDLQWRQAFRLLICINTTPHVDARHGNPIKASAVIGSPLPPSHPRSDINVR